jgi:hypothetical protein
MGEFNTLIYDKSHYLNKYKPTENIESIINTLNKPTTYSDKKGYKICWNFFNFTTSSPIDTKNNKIIFKQNNSNVRHNYINNKIVSCTELTEDTTNYKNILLNFIHYKYTLTKNYKKPPNLSSESFTLIANSEFNNIVNYEHKTIPLLIFKNFAIVGLFFLNEQKLEINNINFKDIYIKHFFLIEKNNCITKFNNYNLIKGILNTKFNNKSIETPILINNKIKLHCTLKHILSMVENYFWILTF